MNWRLIIIGKKRTPIRFRNPKEYRETKNRVFRKGSEYEQSLALTPLRFLGGTKIGVLF